MHDRSPFHPSGDDQSPERLITNRILRFESGAMLAVAEAPPACPLPVQFPTLDFPHRICLPEGYEPGYAYPLLVWLHDDGADERELDDVLPRISNRNYLGVSLRGNLTQEPGSGWTTADAALLSIIDDVHKLVAAAEDRFLIHADRVYLAGHGTGGTLAWEILLRQPSQWAGAICLSADFPQIDHPLAMFRHLQRRRLLLSTGLDRPAAQVKQLIGAGRLMYSAGLEVGTRIYDSGRRGPSDKMLRDVDRWVMDSIATAVR